MSNEDLKESALKVASQVAEDVYNDAIQPAAKNVGGILETITGFFNHVVLCPLKMLNSKCEQKAKAFEKNMERKYNSIPKDQRVEPQLHIVGPAMEALKYNIMEDDLAEMFANLLVSDMDADVQKLCTPAFIKIIEQLSPNDAKLFNILYHKGSCAVCEIIYHKKGDKQYILRDKYVPQYFINSDGIDMDVYDISRSLNNLERLGLIQLSFIKRVSDLEEYGKIFSMPIVSNIAKKANEMSGYDYIPSINLMGIISCSDFSKAFAKVCLRA